MFLFSDLHVEDHELASLSYLVKSDTKVWYVHLPRQMRDFKQVCLKQLFNIQYLKLCLRQKFDAALRLQQVIQRQGSLVVVALKSIVERTISNTTMLLQSIALTSHGFGVSALR